MSWWLNSWTTWEVLFDFILLFPGFYTCHPFSVGLIIFSSWSFNFCRSIPLDARRKSSLKRRRRRLSPTRTTTGHVTTTTFANAPFAAIDEGKEEDEGIKGRSDYVRWFLNPLGYPLCWALWFWFSPGDPPPVPTTCGFAVFLSSNEHPQSWELRCDGCRIWPTSL